MMHCRNNYSYTFIELDETDSTNNYLRNYSTKNKTEAFTAVLSAYQNAGKGQRGNSWESAPGKNLLCSFLVYPSFLKANEQFLLSQIISLSIQEELSTYASDFTIKWPNDIYWQDKKICGILIENDLASTEIQKSIIGFGLNLNQHSFISEAPNPISLTQITGESYPITSIAINILNRFISYYETLKENKRKEICMNYHHCLYRKGFYHNYKDKSGSFKGKIIEVRNNGLLVIEDENQKERVYTFKEIIFEK